MYLTLFVTGCGTIVMAVFGLINWQYFFVLNVLVAIGTFPGLFLQGWCVRKTGRAS